MTLNEILKELKERDLERDMRKVYEFSKRMGLWTPKGEQALFSLLVEKVEECDETFTNEFGEFIVRNGYLLIFKAWGFDEASGEDKPFNEEEVEKAKKEALREALIEAIKEVF